MNSSRPYRWSPKVGNVLGLFGCSGGNSSTLWRWHDGNWQWHILLLEQMVQLSISDSHKYELMVKDGFFLENVSGAGGFGNTTTLRKRKPTFQFPEIRKQGMYCSLYAPCSPPVLKWENILFLGRLCKWHRPSELNLLTVWCLQKEIVPLPPLGQ